AEEEREPAHAGVGAALLEGLVVEAVDEDTEDEEHRHQERAGEHRVEAGAARDEPGAVGPEHHDRRMRDVRHVQQAERDRQADADRGVEAPEQDAEDHGLEQQLEREFHALEKETARDRRAAVHVVRPPYLRIFSNGPITSPVLNWGGNSTTCLPGWRNWSTFLSATPRNWAMMTRGFSHSPLASQRIGPTIVFTSFLCSHAAS